MTKVQLDQYVALKKKATLSTEETAVVNAFEAAYAARAATTATPAVTEAEDVLEDAQEALVAKPSTTV